MRHLTRLYFENTSVVEQFVSLVDQGVERVVQGDGQVVFIPLYSIKVGNISNPMTLTEAMEALQFLQFTPCFFKLPSGAHAIVDIYIPDLSESRAPKVFDYQVFKASNPERPTRLAGEMAEFRQRLNQIPASVFQPAAAAAEQAAASSSPSGPAGPVTASGPTGPATSICCYSSSGPAGPMHPCGGQTSIPCADPIFTRASCVNGQLYCVSLEPPRDDKSCGG